MRTLIAGIGNVLLGDDAAGPTLVEMLRARYDLGPDVVVEDLGTPGLDLALHIAGYDTLVLVDALSDPDLAPGAVRVFDQAAIMSAAVPARLDPHSPALREALMLCSLDGSAPRRVFLFGLAAESCEVGSTFSPAVRAALEPALLSLLSELQTLGIACPPRIPPQAPNLWWLRD